MLTDKSYDHGLLEHLFGNEYTRKRVISARLRKEDPEIKQLKLRHYLGDSYNNNYHQAETSDLSSARTSHTNIYRFQSVNVEVAKKSANKKESVTLFELQDETTDDKYVIKSFSDNHFLNRRHYRRLTNANSSYHGLENFSKWKIANCFSRDEHDFIRALVNIPKAKATSKSESLAHVYQQRKRTSCNHQRLTMLDSKRKNSKEMTSTAYFQYCYKYNLYVIERMHFDSLFMYHIKGIRVKHPYNRNFVPSHIQCYDPSRFNRIFRHIMEMNQFFAKNPLARASESTNTENENHNKDKYEDDDEYSDDDGQQSSGPFFIRSLSDFKELYPNIDISNKDTYNEQYYEIKLIRDWLVANGHINEGKKVPRSSVFIEQDP
ncbi:hypothetical protein DASC09_004680 [Saccharomycopsis crataegensis]|uniref:Uncharacterized protein n=1 Tax=Saccharomycopsis crataegensis TaxID=43959 RepID=A0AAV5QEG4_9ASCO|nr:hypothetical protein DASC09_004680 [Saccharomycopsis crataegensis]